MNHIDSSMGDFFRVTPNPGDYLDAEGFIICGTCGERRQQMHGIGLIPSPCACKRAENERIEAETKAQQHRQTVESILQRGKIDGKLRTLTFDTLDDQNARITALCKNYVQRWGIALTECHGILLYGNPGTGKTHHACAMANALAEKECSVYFGTVQEILTRLRSSVPEVADKTLRMIKGADFLFLDDFGAARDTDYQWEQVYGLINIRYSARKPTILTTNLAPDMLEASTDPWLIRINSRITEMCQIPLRLVGEDRRKQKAAAAREDCRKLYL